ncbi:MAG: hypothetical protein PHX13_12380, partial [Thiovulaceae bacterium]|nr:hypothetical protein [Sulfurimonadaceae bacterium]
VDACQIPENILKAITTRALVETCLSYPLYLNYMAYNDLDQGIISVISRFNGLSELYSRSNAITSILDVYEKMKVQVTATWTDGSMDFAFHIAYFEMVMSADCFFNKFTTSERTRLKTALWQKLYDRVQDPEHYSLFSIIEGLHLYAKVLKAQNDPVYVSNKVLIDYVSSVCRVRDQQYIDFANLIFF